MSAFAQHKFVGTALIDEERLRKISDIISKRFQAADVQDEINYTIYRTDGLYYVTPNLDDILKEDNSSWQKISRVLIQNKVKGEISLEVNITRSDISLDIQGEDRDFVFLIFSDLREYISHEVISKGMPQRLSIFVPGIIAACIGSAFVMLLLSNSNVYKDPNMTEQFTTALQSNDVNKKLDYLITSLSKPKESDKPIPTTTAISVSLGAGALILLVITGMLFIPNPANSGTKSLGNNAFLIGKEIEQFRNRREFRSKIIWVVIVGFIVSLLSSMVWWAFTSR